MDPLAERMPALTFPKLTATALVLWSTTAALACALIWGIRLGELAAAATGRAFYVGSLPELAVGLILASGVSSVLLVRPHVGLSRRRCIIAAVGVLAYFPLASFILFMLTRIDPVVRSPYLSLDPTDPQRLGLRLLVGLTLTVILFCLRSNARTLAARSRALRTGRKNRQTLLGMVAAVGVSACGDGIRILGNSLAGLAAEVAQGAGVVLVALGSALLLVGLIASTVDTIRLWPILSQKEPSRRVRFNPLGRHDHG